VLNKDATTNTIKLINYNIEPVKAVYPKKEVVTVVDVSSNQTFVDTYIYIIENSSNKGVRTIR
jgi:hypothetical protein